MRTILKQTLIPLLALAVIGCTAKRMAIEKVSQADLAVRKTVGSDAPKYAAGEVQMAQEKLEIASKAKEDGDYKQACRASEEAMLDAQLADAKTMTAKTHELVQENRKNLNTLRDSEEDK